MNAKIHSFYILDLALLAHNGNQTLCPDNVQGCISANLWVGIFFSKEKKKSFHSVKAQLCWNCHIQGKVATFLGVRREETHCGEKICGGVDCFVGRG